MSTKIEYRASQSRVRFFRRVLQFAGSVGGELCLYESWRQDELELGDSASYGDMKPIRNATPELLAEEDEVYFMPNYCSYSDYSGGSVEMSNCRLILEDFGEELGISELWGDFGTKGLAIPVSKLFDFASDRATELREILRRLDNYPCVDDEDVSRVEMELADEDWQSWARSDFERELAKSLGVDDLELRDGVDDDWRQFFEDWRENANVYWENEQGPSMHVNISRVVAGIPNDIDATPRYGHCKTLRELLSCETVATVIGTDIDWDVVRFQLSGEQWEEDDWGNQVRRVYLGSVFNLTPSGKFYTPWANSNVTEEEAELDAAWWGLLEEEAEQIGCYVESGEGDPTDIFVVESREQN